MAIELTDEQLDLKRRIIHWYRHYGQGKPYYYYSGAAGTGKTTVIHSIVEELGLKKNEYMGCAYVGKAVLVLLRHGINASTIHSLIYTPMFVTEKTVMQKQKTQKHIQLSSSLTSQMLIRSRL